MKPFPSPINSSTTDICNSLTAKLLLFMVANQVRIEASYTRTVVSHIYRNVLVNEVKYGQLHHEEVACCTLYKS